MTALTQPARAGADFLRAGGPSAPEGVGPQHTKSGAAAASTPNHQAPVSSRKQDYSAFLTTSDADSSEMRLSKTSAKLGHAAIITHGAGGATKTKLVHSGRTVTRQRGDLKVHQREHAAGAAIIKKLAAAANEEVRAEALGGAATVTTPPAARRSQQQQPQQGKAKSDPTRSPRPKLGARPKPPPMPSLPPPQPSSAFLAVPPPPPPPMPSRKTSSSGSSRRREADAHRASSPATVAAQRKSESAQSSEASSLPEQLEEAQQQRPLPRWTSLKSRGAKLYAWACAARLSSGKGAGLAIEEDESSEELSECARRARRARGEALEAATRMLEYLGLHDEEIGSRLSIEALREIGADDDALFSEGPPSGSLDDDDDGPEREAFSSTRPTSTSSNKDARAADVMGKLLRKVATSQSQSQCGSGGAIATHLATFRFQRALDAESGGHRREPSGDKASSFSSSRKGGQKGSSTITMGPFSAAIVADRDPGERSDGGLSSRASFFDDAAAQSDAASSVVLSAASARAAKAYGLLSDSSGNRSGPTSPPPPSSRRTSLPSRTRQERQHGGPQQRDQQQRDRQTAGGIRAPRKALELFPKTRAVALLHAALTRGDARAIRRAAVAGAGSEDPDEIGAFATMARALHVAAARDGAFGAPRSGAVETVVALGADITAPDAFGYTPLHVAAACGNFSATEALLKCCATEKEATILASKRCHAGLAPVEVALARRRDMRDLLASMLCRARAFDVQFGPGPLGIKLALVRHAVVDSPSPTHKKTTNGDDKVTTKAPLLPNSLAASTSLPAEWTATLSSSSSSSDHHRRNLSVDRSSAVRAAHHHQNASCSRSSSGGPAAASPSTSPTHRRVRSQNDAEGRAKEHGAPRTLQVTSIAATCDARHELEPGDQLLAINGAVVACPDETDFPDVTRRIKRLGRPLRATFVAGNFPHLSVEDDAVLHLLAPFSPDPAPAHVDVLCSSRAELVGADGPSDAPAVPEHASAASSDFADLDD